MVSVFTPIPAAKDSPAHWGVKGTVREMREGNIWEPGDKADAEFSVYFFLHFRKIDSSMKRFDVLLITK